MTNNQLQKYIDDLDDGILHYEFVKFINNLRCKINQTPISKDNLFYDDKKIITSDKVLDDYTYTGLSTCDFFNCFEDKIINFQKIYYLMKEVNDII